MAPLTGPPRASRAPLSVPARASIRGAAKHRPDGRSGGRAPRSGERTRPPSRSLWPASREHPSSPREAHPAPHSAARDGPAGSNRASECRSPVRRHAHVPPVLARGSSILAHPVPWVVARHGGPHCAAGPPGLARPITVDRLVGGAWSGFASRSQASVIRSAHDSRHRPRPAPGLSTTTARTARVAEAPEALPSPGTARGSMGISSLATPRSSTSSPAVGDLAEGARRPPRSLTTSARWPSPGRRAGGPLPRASRATLSHAPVACSRAVGWQGFRT